MKVNQSPTSPNFIRAALRQAVAVHESGQISRAAKMYEELTHLAPNSGEAYDLLGVAQSQMGQHAEALKNIRKALHLNGKLESAKTNLGQALLSAGRLPEAISQFKVLISENPFNERAFVGLSQAHVNSEQVDDAINVLEIATARFPNSAAFLNERGRVASMLGKNNTAAADYRRALQINPRFLTAAINLGSALTELREFAEAEAVFSRLLKETPRNCDAIRGLGTVYRQTAQLPKAIELALKGLKISPNDPGLLTLHGMCLFDLGHNAEAEPILRRVIADGVDVYNAISNFATLHKFSASDSEIALTDKLLQTSMKRPDRRKQLLFARAKMHDDVGEYGKAVAAAVEAKTINPTRNIILEALSFSEQFQIELDAPFFAARRSLGNQSEQPVFIVGMPRSGTTLTEQIIASHPMADGAGELVTIPEFRKNLGIREDCYLPVHVGPTGIGHSRILAMADEYLTILRADHKPDSLRITDKLPHNFQNLWLIAQLFPNARIIHCKRDAVDVCMSIFLRNFNDSHWYTNDLATLGKFYKLYEEQVAHWKAVCGLRWYENKYEQLVADPEPNIRRMIDFLGLPWDEKCLSHTETERSVRTFSKWQVRQPIYRSSVEKWRRYAPYIGPLLKELGVEAT